MTDIHNLIAKITTNLTSGLRYQREFAFNAVGVPTDRATVATNHVTTGSPRTAKKSTKASAEKKAQAAPIIGVLGAKGGAGATTTAINICAALGRRFGGATLIDANLQQPDAATILGKDVEHSLSDLVGKKDNLEPRLLNACGQTIDENTRLLSPPIDGRAAMAMDLSAVAACLDSMRQYSGGWVIDLPRHLDKHLVTLLDRCDIIVLVFEPTLAAALSAQRWLKIFADLDYPADKIICAVTRSGGKLKTVESQIGSLEEFGSLAKIPNSFELLERCAAMGQIAVNAHKSHTYASAIGKLCDAIDERLQKNGGA
jgi:Flp pilus assembly CpaE family ATPase